MARFVVDVVGFLVRGTIWSWLVRGSDVYLPRDVLTLHGRQFPQSGCVGWQNTLTCQCIVADCKIPSCLVADFRLRGAISGAVLSLNGQPEALIAFNLDGCTRELTKQW